MKTILLIDDNEVEHFLNKEVVKSFDPSIEILTAYDGVEALEMLKAGGHKPDAILLDINMPRMNGHEFLDAYAREFGVENRVPVIVMLTTSAQDIDKEKTSVYKCVKDYFIKPLSPEYLEHLKKIYEENSKD